MTATPPALPDRLRPALAVFYRHASPRVLTALFAAALAARIALGDASLFDLAIPAAIVLLWPLQEWLIHVCILHYEPVKVLGRRLDFKVPILHRAHHRDPWRLDLVFIPTHVFLYVPLAVAGAFWLGASRPALAAAALAAYFALSLHYEWVHFMIHTRYRPRLGYYQRLAHNHLLHHFRNEHYWFGVTMLQADRWLRTAPEPDAVPKSTLALALAPPSGG